MSNTATALALIGWLIGFAVPWLWGTLLCWRLVRSTSSGLWAWCLGNGYLIGLLTTTLLLRTFNFFGQPFHFGFSLVVLLALSLLVYLWPKRLKMLPSANIPTMNRSDASKWFIGLLLILLSLHGLSILGEIFYRPLFPWDAWSQWTTKAKVWFSLGKMVPFVDYQTWASAAFDAAHPIYTDAAPHYGATVPLFQVWTALSLGYWDDALINLPWFGLWLSLVLTSYGYARLWPLSPIVALTIAYGIGSLPFLNIHAMLAGYADLPQASVYTLAGLAMIFWLRFRNRTNGLAFGFAALFFGLACSFIKQPGIIWTMTLLPPLLIGWKRALGWKILAGMIVISCIALAICTQTEVTLLRYTFHAEWRPIGEPLLDNLLFYGNWNLLFWLFPLALCLGWRRFLPSSRQVETTDWQPFLVLIMAGAGFLFLGFGFTHIANWVEDYSTVNRAILHWAPLCAFFTFTLLAECWQTSRYHDYQQPTESIASSSTSAE